MKSKLQSRLLLLGGAAAVLIIDQLSKLWVARSLPMYSSVDIIPWLSPVLTFTYVKNTGIAFGLFPQLGEIFKYLSAFVIVGLFAFQRTIPASYVWVHISLGLVTGGALGNLLDRLTRGFVVDFFDLTFWPLRRWAVFNIADAAIVVGVTILLIDSFLSDEASLGETSLNAEDQTVSEETMLSPEATYVQNLESH